MEKIFTDSIVPSLQQMSPVEIAVTICNDLDVKAVIKNFGLISFAFPSKILHSYVEKNLCKRLIDSEKRDLIRRRQIMVSSVITYSLNGNVEKEGLLSNVVVLSGIKCSDPSAS
ncbi:hypothetical protein NPIL_284591 [Nephila pilipes]|uniref:Uncharacterized protein n=1 Tax=Nephila pilipes TaxID=299642 RepID=A0A8X6MWT7_NEPPI|nr:hypothetical protein NPIL_284591 [Nephila pilipes]